MSNQLNIRNVPSDLRHWIRRETQRSQQKQNEFLISTLRQAAQLSYTPTLPFDLPQVHPTLSDDRLPFSFIDLFAGIGGFRIALEENGGKCIFTSEWDRYSQRTYSKWFGEMPRGDITQIRPSDIPNHDILAAGFPCQPFSIAGVSKKNSLGRLHGFKCTTQGTLFFNIATIAEIKRPPVLLLENVKNLKSHDQGRTWETINGHLEALHYKVFVDVIDAAGWVPQHRERVYIVAFDRYVFGDNPPFEFPAPPENSPKLQDVLEEKPDPKYTLTDHLWGYLQEYAERHREKGNGFGFGLADLEGISRTLSARYYKDGSEILIPQARKNPRRLTPRECQRLMGFPDDPQRFPIVVSDTQAYRQFGNAVVPKVASAVVRSMLPVLRGEWDRQNKGCLLKRPYPELEQAAV
ncbi:MAG: DNA (cytosine-5-)-methyltransferase [Acidobacteriaceae bacterium]